MIYSKITSVNENKTTRVPKSGAKEPEWRFGLRFHKGGAKKEPQFWHFSLTKTQIVAVFNSKHLGTLFVGLLCKFRPALLKE